MSRYQLLSLDPAFRTHSDPCTGPRPVGVFQFDGYKVQITQLDSGRLRAQRSGEPGEFTSPLHRLWYCVKTLFGLEGGREWTLGRRDCAKVLAQLSTITPVHARQEPSPPIAAAAPQGAPTASCGADAARVASAAELPQAWDQVFEFAGAFRAAGLPLAGRNALLTGCAKALPILRQGEGLAGKGVIDDAMARRWYSLFSELKRLRGGDACELAQALAHHVGALGQDEAQAAAVALSQWARAAYARAPEARLVILVARLLPHLPGAFQMKIWNVLWNEVQTHGWVDAAGQVAEAWLQMVDGVARQRRGRAYGKDQRHDNASRVPVLQVLVSLLGGALGRVGRQCAGKRHQAGALPSPLDPVLAPRPSPMQIPGYRWSAAIPPDGTLLLFREPRLKAGSRLQPPEEKGAAARPITARAIEMA